jgi:hypothetical protein
MAGKQPPAMSAVVRARIVMPTEALGALRDVINQIIGIAIMPIATIEPTTAFALSHPSSSRGFLR